MDEMIPGKPHRAALSSDEKLTAAYMHIVRGLKQEDLAALYNVNSGRIAEAVKAIRVALQNA